MSHMKREDIIKPENKVYSRPRLLDKNIMHYCPGCSHGVVHNLWQKSSRNWASRIPP